MVMLIHARFPAVALLVSLASGPDVSIETRTLSSVSQDREGVSLIFNQRIVAEGTIVLSSRAVQPDGSVAYSQREYRMDATPVSSWQEGFWSDRWNRFETRYGSEGAEQTINETTSASALPDSTFRDPTVLWFWSTHPRVNETVVVTYLAQNVIATSQIRHTYEGDEEMTLAGRTFRAHRVREEPVGTRGVYTLWWFDDEGMGVKRFHKTTQQEFTDELVAWR